MKKIVHIVTDEKFINSAYWQFNEIFPKKNTFYLLVDDTNRKLKHVILNEDFIIIENNLKSLKSLANKFSNNEIVVFHGMHYYRSIVLNHLSDNCKIIWMLWGIEVYNNPYINDQAKLYGNLTSDFILRSVKEKFRHFVKKNTRQFYYKLKKRTEAPNKLILKAIKKADYCGILYQEEFEIVQKSINTEIKFLKFSYYPIELMVGENKARIKANNILIGNSASLTNNHLEAFELLKTLPVQNRKIIVPLSYGDPKYAKSIIGIGNKMFPDVLEPLVDFMPLHEYNKHLEQCGIVIMNHYRQQAVGNVLTMLWMGAKVYLDERNTLFHYLKRIGIYVFSIQKDLRSDNPNVFNLLEKNFQESNREILKGEIGQKALLEKLRSQLETIMHEH